MLGTEPGKTPRVITAASLQKAGQSETDLERVLLLIKQVADEARQFEDQDKSAKVLVIAGDLLWHYELARRAPFQHDGTGRSTRRLQADVSQWPD